MSSILREHFSIPAVYCLKQCLQFCRCISLFLFDLSLGFQPTPLLFQSVVSSFASLFIESKFSWIWESKRRALKKIPAVNVLQSYAVQDFAGGPVAKTAHCQRVQVRSLVRELNPTWCNKEFTCCS